MIFQLTPSRRATIPPVTSKRVFNISTHALTEGDKYEEEYGVRFHISTHALTEGDADIFCRFLRQKISTHALTEGDLGQSFHRCCRSCISTHALTEGDCDVRRYVRICTCICRVKHGSAVFGVWRRRMPKVMFTGWEHGAMRTGMHGYRKEKKTA